MEGPPPFPLRKEYKGHKVTGTMVKGHSPGGAIRPRIQNGVWVRVHVGPLPPAPVVAQRLWLRDP